MILRRSWLAAVALAVACGGGRAQTYPQAYTPPSEFGVMLEFDGSRAELEAAGLRVVTQAGRLFTARVRRDEIALLLRNTLDAAVAQARVRV